MLSTITPYIPPKQRFNLTNDKFAEFLLFIERELGWEIQYDCFFDEEPIQMTHFNSIDGNIGIEFNGDSVGIAYFNKVIKGFSKDLDIFYMTYRSDLIAITNLLKNGNNN